MIKYICDRCKQEVKTQTFFCEVIVRKLSQIGNPFLKRKQQNVAGVEELKYHFCDKCWQSIRIQFK